MLAPNHTVSEPPRAQFSPRSPNRGRRPPLRGGPVGWPRIRRVALLSATLVMIPVAVSFVKTVARPSNSGFGINAVEWLRDNGARAIVNQIETWYYSLNAPSTGGPALKALPKQAGAVAALAAAKRAAAYRPPAIAPVITPALAGEGVWHATFAGGGPQPPVLISSFRPDPNYPQLVAGVAWINHLRTSTWLYPGRLEPNVPVPARGPMEVPTSARGNLVATFNSGFKLADSGGGFAVGGHTDAPLKRGLGTIVRYRDGHVDVISWAGGPNITPDIVYARQNLPLIVNNGQPNPKLSDGAVWGATLGNAIRVWRSSVGVDSKGNLMYAAANDQTVGSLAKLMMRAGAVRAMELDINTYWTSFITYHHPGAIGAANLLPTMDRSPQRYLTPDDRDFFAVYLH
jgi:Phosphodiester glycosidase